MNPEFNVNESNLQPPLIHNRFRKLILQSPKQSNVQHNLPESVAAPQSKLATENVVKTPVLPYESQTQTITNKLMLSTSSGNNIERTNFIKGGTKPFTNLLQAMESTENGLLSKQVKNTENELPKNISRSSYSIELASQMEKLDVSRLSSDLFSQFGSGSKLSLPPNPILSYKDNVENRSQRMSNIHMSDNKDLADTQPNTPSQLESKWRNANVDMQQNGCLIVLSSDGEDDNVDGTNKSLLTEESEDDSVIEVLSSDGSIEVTKDRIPQNVSPLNTLVKDEEVSESVAQKLNHFFDNIPKLDPSNYFKCNSGNYELVGSDLTIPEAEESKNKNVDHHSALELQASQSDGDLDKSGSLSNDKCGSLVQSNENEKSQKNELIYETDEANTEDDESASRSVQDESNNIESIHLLQSTVEKQVSIHETKKKIEFEKIRTSSTNVIGVNSPVNNINIHVSGFSSTSSDPDLTLELSSKNNETLISETSINSSQPIVTHCRKKPSNHISGSNSKKFHVASLNQQTTKDDEDYPHQHNNEISSESSVIESSISESQGTKVVESENEEYRTSGICESLSSVHIAVKESTDTSTSSVHVEKEPIGSEKFTINQDENNVSVAPMDSSMEIDEIDEKLLNEIYGDTWRTPQLIKKCMSTKKKFLTDVAKRSKVAPYRILDDRDEEVDDQSDSSSFEPIPSDSDEESDNSFEKLAGPTPTRHEDHENPDATPTELEKVVETFLESLQTETRVKTPAPAKQNVHPNVTRRKFRTPYYDDQAPFEEMKTPERLPSENNNKIIQIKTPIPSYLIRGRAKIEGEPIFPNTLFPSRDLKKLQEPRTPVPAPSHVCGFMESLDEKLIPVEHCDPDALKFRIKFEQNRNELVKRLMKIFNHYIFDNKLAKVPVYWNKRLATTAGRCHLRKKGGVRIAFVDLSEKVCTSADRIRDTLVHELCHAAAWIIDNDSASHGKIWKYWADRANKTFPELPKIKRCHNYDIAYKYTYKCTICGLKSQSHSKSKKVENMRCAACHGPIELFLNQIDEDGKKALVPQKEPSIFAKFVKENYKSYKVSGSSHTEVMNSLSKTFWKVSAFEKLKLTN